MKHFPILSLLAVTVMACSSPQPEPFSVIPMPDDVTLGEGAFKIAGQDFFVDASIDPEAQTAICDFWNQLCAVSGKKSTVGSEERGQKVRFLPNPNLGAEEYALNIDGNGVVAEASAFPGFFYAIQTLKQMLPAEIYGTKKVSAAWVLPYASILDSPRFDYRGILLDPCRHFWTVEETKRIIDIASIYKINRLHWHLTEDQGWRWEVKKYPGLTEIGAWRNGTCIGKDFTSNDGIRHGGFYTQDELRDVVEYARRRGITVIPEIDLPGHMLAALAAYPELGCTGGPYEVWTRWGISEDVLCVGKEETFTFLEDILTELIDIFPSEYIHIGGDECPKVRWVSCPRCQARIKQLGLKAHGNISAEQELQCYVTARIQKFLNDRGRKIIGWDEILEGNLAPGATVMSWRGVKGGIEAARRGFDVVMTPNKYLYIDYYQSQEVDKEPFGIGGYVPVGKVYGYEPYEGMDPGTESHILGVQANLWTEYIVTPEHLEYMLLPRLCALSEVQWCDASHKDYARFDASLDHAFRIFDVMGFTYAKHVRGVIGLPGSEQPARTPEELEEYLAQRATER
ncbi:MAG: beta-N-acetylhexosaminidase [Bacteroidales bacterium]|nr:beta-N-acetylhexosaminidase [Bacteroidales bacterium]